ncbi:MAG: VWA domain-containing protein [Deltaproteobacteria bacterium]|nr:VWA domain-containing protein [Deltaproteobacteria bacterium]
MKFAPVLALLLLVACGPAVNGGGDDSDTGGDADGDTISDTDEGRESGVDTDKDGTPDFEDADSDGDGIPDYREAGDVDAGSNPVDTDEDGTPDFRDLDSDENGRPDDLDGVNDVDGDALADFQDLDDDGDNIYDIDELGPNALDALDTDNDGTPDYRDTDSDDDTILDLEETKADYDSDTIGNYQDLDSDGDCVPDRLEKRGTPTADTDMDGRPDFIDRDSDDDGVLDVSEDVNCNGMRDGNESDPMKGDTDMDGVSDLIEVAAGTNPNNPTSNPQANGDFVFVEPYQEPQMPLESNLDFSTKLQAVDLYVLLDRSGSMSQEISTVKSNLSTVVSNLACPPLGNGSPGNCIPDLWAGAATIGYAGAGAAAFQNWVDIQPNASFASVPVTEPTGSSNTQEPLTFGAYAAVTGQGGASFGMSSVPARSGCGAGRFGYPCFRSNALPVVLLATDEPPLSAGDTQKTPDWATIVRPAFISKKARLVGILGSGFTAGTDTDLRTMATQTGAVDAANGNSPLVFDGAGANAASAIQTGIFRLANGLPLDINAVAADDPSDSVNAVTSFIGRLQTLQLGSAQCANGLTDVDTNGDTFKDKFLQVRTGTPVCWKVVSKPNTTVPATSAPQLFKATVTVYGDGITQLDQRDVYFLVPPKNADGPIQ